MADELHTEADDGAATTEARHDGAFRAGLVGAEAGIRTLTRLPSAVFESEP